MAEIRISELTPASTPAGTEVLAIVQSNDTKKTTINSLATALEDNLSTGAPTWTTDGILTAGYHIIAGGNHDGRVALTINDGYGNANITFNHTNGIPDRSGSSARIVSSVDSNQEVLDFQLKGGVIAGSPLPLTSVLKLFDDKIQLLKPTTLSTSGTTTTSLVNKGYIDSALNNKANISHTHNEYALSSHLHDGRYSQLGHTHTIANITNLQNTLDGKIGETEINGAHFTFANNTLSLNTIQEGQIATDAITTTKIKNNAVDSAKITDGAVTTSKIDDGAVTTAKIENITDMKVLGNTSGSAASPQEIDIISESAGISNNDNDITIPTSAAVKDYVDTASAVSVASFTKSGGTITTTGRISGYSESDPDGIVSESGGLLTVGAGVYLVYFSGSYTEGSGQGSFNVDYRKNSATVNRQNVNSATNLFIQGLTIAVVTSSSNFDIYLEESGVSSIVYSNVRIDIVKLA